MPNRKKRLTIALKETLICRQLYRFIDGSSYSFADTHDPTFQAPLNLAGSEARFEDVDGAAKCPILRPRHGPCPPPVVAPVAAEVATSSRFQRV